MSKFVREMLDQAAQRTDVNGPVPGAEPLKKTDRVLGTVPPELRALFFVMHERKAELDDCEAKLLSAEVDLEFDATKLAELSREIRVLSLRHQTLHKVFWTELRLEIPETFDLDNGSLSLRENWELVVDSEEAHPLEGLIGAIFGRRAA